MCRIIGFISVHPILLEDLLINPPHSLTVHTRYLSEGRYGINRNLDGFGVGWYTSTLGEFDNSISGPRPALYRTMVAQPANDAVFLSVCQNTASNAILSHIRAAFAPPVVPTNNHPFVLGRISLAHNGEIARFREIRPKMLELTHQKYADMIHGSTDTEHFAALYISRLEEVQKEETGVTDLQGPCSSSMMWTALKRAIRQVLDIQGQAFTSGGGQLSNSFNICTTNGESLVVLRYNSNPATKPPTLFVSFTAADKLNRKSNNRIYEDRRSPFEIDTEVKNIVENTRYASEDTRIGAHIRVINSVYEFLKRSRTVEPRLDPALQKHLVPSQVALQKSEPGGYHGPHVIVASEPLTYEAADWRQLRMGEAMLVDNNGRELTIRFESLE